MTLDPKQTCSSRFLTSKECDKECNLCACATIKEINEIAQPEHCSGHGSCSATCYDEKCHSAHCVCDHGYGGHQCELGDNSFQVLRRF